MSLMGFDLWTPYTWHHLGCKSLQMHPLSSSVILIQPKNRNCMKKWGRAVACLTVQIVSRRGFGYQLHCMSALIKTITFPARWNSWFQWLLTDFIFPWGTFFFIINCLHDIDGETLDLNKWVYQNAGLASSSNSPSIIIICFCGDKRKLSQPSPSIGSSSNVL